MFKRQGQEKESDDSSRKVEVIIIASDDLIRWHGFKTDDDGITSEGVLGNIKQADCSSHKLRWGVYEGLSGKS